MTNPERANPERAKTRLDQIDLALLTFIERFHSMSGVTPNNETLVDALVSSGKTVSTAEVVNRLGDPLFRKSLDVRGITLTSEIPSQGFLTVRQMEAASVMANVIDRRSDEKKLRDLGISTAEWEGWMADRNFAAYMAGRLENRLGNSVHEAHLSLIRGVRSGNVPAIKLFYEITGRYNPDQTEQVNLRMVLQQVIEVIQRHVLDPNALDAIASDMTQIMLSASQRASSIPGEVATSSQQR